LAGFGSLASINAIAAPMPFDALVTTETLPFKSLI
jgi:hypothetical protein